MSSEKRLVLFMILTFFSFLAIQYVMDVTGLNPPPPKAPPQAQAKAKPDEAKPKPEQVADAGKPQAKAKDPEKEKKGEAQAAAPKEPRTPIVPASKLVLGSTTDKTPGGYRLQVQLEQKGAGVDLVLSSRFDAEFDAKFGKGRNPRRLPLMLLHSDRL